MKQSAFENLHQESWQKLEQLLTQLEKKSATSPPELERFALDYRKLCHLHALAKERNYSSYLVDHLEHLVVRGHQQLYQRKSAFWHQTIAFVVAEFPALVRREKVWVLWASALLYVPSVIWFLLTWLSPEWVYAVLDPASAMEMETMYAPDNRVLGSARDANTNWTMFGYYIQNNISVAFRTFASGLLFGLGSIFFLVYNGTLFGAVTGHLVTVGHQTSFFTFVVGHASFELTAITIAGAAGLKLGYSLLAPGNQTRAEALRTSAQVAIRLVYGVILMLVIAAFIEAFWSSNNVFPPWQKYSIGAILWAVVGAWLLGSGRGVAER